MKLRLENGNFSIKETRNEETGGHVYNSLPTGLKPIDFIGAVVESDNGDANVVFGAYISPENDDVLQLTGGDSFYYNTSNGKVGYAINDVVDDDSTDEGGSDDGNEGK